ncbi:MAG: hypothetical protein ACJA02_001114 [Myxococcota bacterium]|jgi:hypothetical protein
MIEINPKKDSFLARTKKNLIKILKATIFVVLAIGAIYLIILMSFIFIVALIAFMIISFFVLNL